MRHLLYIFPILIFTLLSYQFIPAQKYYEQVSLRVFSFPKVDIENNLFLLDKEGDLITKHKILGDDYKVPIYHRNFKGICFSYPVKSVTINNILHETDKNNCLKLKFEIKGLENEFTRYSKYLGFLLRICLLGGLFFLIRYMPRSFHVKFLTIFLGQSLYSYFFGPAFFDIDLSSTLHAINNLYFSDWFSLAYYFICLAFFDLSSSFLTYAFFQIFFYALFCAYFWELAARYFNGLKLHIFFIILFSWPSIAFMNLYLTRDWLFMLLIQSCFALTAIGHVLDGKVVRKLDHLVIFTSFTLLFLIRREFVLQGSIFILLICLRILKFKYAKLSLGLSLLAILSFSFLDHSLNKNSYSSQKKVLISMGIPITTILRSPKQDLDIEDYKFLSHYYKLEVLTGHYSRYFPKGTEAGAIREESLGKSKERWQFYTGFLRIIKKNMGIFLKERFEFLYMLYSAFPYTARYPHDWMLCRYEGCERNANLYGLDDLKWEKRERHSFFKLRQKISFGFWGELFFNMLPLVAFSILTLFFYKIVPYSAVFASLLLGRQLVLFVLAPALYFKYITPMYFGCLLLMVITLLELRLNKKVKWCKARK